MKRLLLVILPVFCLVASNAAAQDIYVVNNANANPTTLLKDEADITKEVNGPVHQAYPAAAQIQFVQTQTPDAWPVYLVPLPLWSQTGEAVCESFWSISCMGFHLSNPVSLWVAWTSGPVCLDGNCSDLEVSENILAHEVVEAAVDPTGLGTEVCDTVGSRYPLDGLITLAAFVRPDGSVWSGFQRKVINKVFYVNRSRLIESLGRVPHTTHEIATEYLRKSGELTSKRRFRHRREIIFKVLRILESQHAVESFHETEDGKSVFYWKLTPQGEKWKERLHVKSHT